MSSPLRTPLYSRHLELGAKMMDFAGFSMPVQYESIKTEHAAVREQAGLFDVSHMGQIHFRGARAADCLESLLTCPIENLATGRVRYGLMCNPDGGCVDDVTVYRVKDDHFFLCVNAANIAKDLEWIRVHTPASDCAIEDQSASTGLLALQGPAAAPLLDRVLGEQKGASPGGLARFQFGAWIWRDAPLWVSRTGYTGADGFELYLEAESTEAFFDLLLREGQSVGLRPAGLGARDTLRLEAALPLYGHELDEGTSPLEANLGRFVKRQQGGFNGHEAMEQRAHRADRRRLIGFEGVGRGIARAGYEICSDGQPVGRVTSGAPSPTLGKSIGLGYVPHALADRDPELTVDVRGRMLAVRVVKTPFVVKA